MLPITDYGSPITDHRSPITDHRLPITDHALPITHYESPPKGTFEMTKTALITGISGQDFRQRLRSIWHIQKIFKCTNKNSLGDKYGDKSESNV